jgi:hypothetical protein
LPAAWPGWQIALITAGAVVAAADPNLTEVVMNHSRRICRFLSGLPRGAGLLTASAASAVLWGDPPLPPGWNKHFPLPVGSQPASRFPPGWNKHPPLPAHVHPLTAGGIPGWQITLIVAAAAVLVAALTITYRAAHRRVSANAA